jgi:uncharacterized protein (TIGR02600 family)
MLGSLPVGVLSGVPYRTLLFRPQTGHPGTNSPPDHLVTDLFWMPVVQPYAISENFSTAGKINLNYAIAPFSYITRSTGLAALLHAEQICAIPNTAQKSAKSYSPDGLTNYIRFGIDISNTLTQFEAKFAAGDIFRSGSQICEIHLVPTNSSFLALSNNSFWASNSMTGDNSREKPYANLLGRVTTKGNTYTVHFRVQALKKAAGSTATVWDEAKDNVTGEYRGSTTIERYISQDASGIPDYATAAASTPNLENYYKWRTISNRQFAP